MFIVKLIDYLKARLKTVIRLCYAVLALLVLYDIFLLDKSKAHTSMEHLPGFWSIFGFVACVIIIIASKWYGHTGIMTREDYYD
jgi:drug/metabolite transporter (DMT)-like permease